MQYIWGILCTDSELPLIVNLINRLLFLTSFLSGINNFLVELIGPEWEHSAFPQIKLILLARALHCIHKVFTVLCYFNVGGKGRAQNLSLLVSGLINLSLLKFVALHWLTAHWN